MPTDLEKLEAILKKRPKLGDHLWKQGKTLMHSDQMFEPWNSIDQAMMLLEGMSHFYRGGSNGVFYCQTWDTKTHKTIGEYGDSMARAIFEAVYLSVKEECDADKSADQEKWT